MGLTSAKVVQILSQNWLKIAKIWWRGTKFLKIRCPSKRPSFSGANWKSQLIWFPRDLCHTKVLECNYTIFSLFHYCTMMMSHTNNISDRGRSWRGWKWHRGLRRVHDNDDRKRIIYRKWIINRKQNFLRIIFLTFLLRLISWQSIKVRFFTFLLFFSSSLLKHSGF